MSTLGSTNPPTKSKNRYLQNALIVVEQRDVLDGTLKKAIEDMGAEREAFERQMNRKIRGLEQTIADRDAYIAMLENKIGDRNGASHRAR